jgi:cardiolipin synthase
MSISPFSCHSSEMTPRTSRSIYKIIPNLLTLVRLLCVPFVAVLILSDQFLLAFSLFCIASVTDFLDGYLARRWNVTSTFGRIFDPLADKALMIVCYLTLGVLSYLPVWIILLVIGRDGFILLAGIVIYLFQVPLKLAPILSSKVNTFFQILLIGMVLALNYTYPKDTLFRFETGIDVFMTILLGLTAITTIWSGVQYGVSFLRRIFYNETR